MDNENHDRTLRQQIYCLLTIIALSIVAGRIATVASKEGDTAFLSANDRSRWCTVAALVEHGSYEIDSLISIEGEKRRRPWSTIDMVRHRGDDGELHFYSSKPTLFPTLVAGVYWLTYQIADMTLTEYPVYMTRIVLTLVNLPLLAVLLCCTIGVIERLATGHWSRIFSAAATCFGTMLLPFSVALNNHLVAAAATALVMYVYVRRAMPDETRPRWWTWVIAGMAAGFAAANELPALSMLACWCVLVLLLDRRATFGFLLGIGITAIGFFATNKIAHDDFRPPYFHRGAGAEITEFESEEQPAIEQLAGAIVGQGFEAGGDLTISPSGQSDRWIVKTVDGHLFALEKQQEEDVSRWQLSHWDDWYDYPGSYWRGDKRRGVDLGEPSQAIYFTHMTVGHYGLLSLTPIWCLVPFGLLLGLFRGPWSIRMFVLAVAVCTGVCMAFYVMRPEIDRNYGGVSSCFRWMLWFAPLWLAVIAPVVDYCGSRRALRGILCALLAGSVFSMAVSLASPWQHPWLYRYWSFLGWLGN